MWDYTDKVLDHFRNPRNVGRIENPDGTGTVGSLACGDSLTLTFRLDAEGRIEDVKFQTFGCASAIASSSALTELVKGKTLDDAAKITNKEIAQFLGGLPEQKMHCSVMGKEALDAAIENYRTGKTVVRDLKEEKVVCKCFGVTEDDIIRVAKENGLKTVDEVTHYCKAGGACGQCRSEIEAILASLAGGEPPPAPEKPKRLTNLQKMRLVEETIEKEIAPVLRRDRGDVDLVDINGDVVTIAFRGMCAGCPSAETTRKDFIEAKLREFVSPEIRVVEEK